MCPPNHSTTICYGLERCCSLFPEFTIQCDLLMEDLYLNYIIIPYQGHRKMLIARGAVVVILQLPHK